MAEDASQNGFGSGAPSKPKHRPGDPYEVGRGKPPRHTQFKKGHKPTRRPPSNDAPDPHAMLMRMINASVSAEVEGQLVRMTVFEVLLVSLKAEAGKGNKRAWRELQAWQAEVPTTLDDKDAFLFKSFKDQFYETLNALHAADQPARKTEPDDAS